MAALRRCKGREDRHVAYRGGSKENRIMYHVTLLSALLARSRAIIRLRHLLTEFYWGYCTVDGEHGTNLYSALELFTIII